VSPDQDLTEARIFAIKGPEPALMRVYFLRAFVGAFGFIFLGSLVALKLGHGAVAGLVESLAKTGELPVVLGGVYAGAYAVSLLVFFIRYRTLRYRFDQDGVAQGRGLLFRRESFLAYARIQDVSVSQGFVERAFGIGTVRIQTASGAKGAEESLEGLRDFALVRDFLKARMRGQKPARKPAPRAAAAPEFVVLAEIRDELRALRSAAVARRRKA
jgi:uncharacterized membrane protein YdbT with pleckstrin-like domain